MKLTGGRVSRFLDAPPNDVFGVLLFGPDRGLVKERSEKLIAVWGDGADEAFSTTVLTADDLSGDTAKLADEMVAMSLLGDQRLVRLRLDHERNGAAISKIIKSLDANPDTCAARLIVEGGDMTPRSAIRKTFEAAGHFAAIGCYADNAADLANLVRRSLNDYNITIEPAALDYWVPLLEGDRALSRNEIDKMILYKGAGEAAHAVVTTTDIKAIASGAQAASLDEIIMAAMNGQPAICDDAFQRAVSGKVNTAIILRSLQRHISRLLEASTLIDSGERAESAIKALRPPVFRMQERNFLSQLRLWRGLQLRRILSQTLIAEEQVKTAGAPADAIVSRLLLAIARFAASKK